MHVFSIFPTNHKVSTIKEQILPKMFRQCSKKVSAIIKVRYKVFLNFFMRVWPWFGRSLKQCPLLPDVRYIACPLYTDLTVTVNYFWQGTKYARTYHIIYKFLPLSKMLAHLCYGSRIRESFGPVFAVLWIFSLY